jgi:hypothetical protein
MPKAQRDLFLPTLPEGAEQTYRNLFAPEKDRVALMRDRCEALWRDFHDLADPAFVDRLPFEFHQRWFEMYIGVALRQVGLHVEAPKPGPDFRVVVDGSPIYIEAIAPTAGNPLHADAVPEPVYRDTEGHAMAVSVPHDQITLRLADAFRRKADVIDGYRRKCYIGERDPCLIAISLRDIPHAWADAEEFWFRALYGAGGRFVLFDRNGQAQREGREHRALLHRASGAAEDVAPLVNPDRAGVSGVLGSAADVGNVPSPLGDDFLLMPHATALTPYPQSFLPRGTEILLRSNDTGSWDAQAIDYGAHPSRGPESIQVNVSGRLVDAEWSVEGRELTVRVGSRRSSARLAGGHDPEATARAFVAEIIASGAHRDS